MKSSGIDSIDEKLEVFIKRYYLQQSYQGLIIFVATFITLVLLFSFIAYQFYLSTAVRTFLFFGFLAATGIVLISQVLLPVSKYFNFGKRLSKAQAATIIGTHFKNDVDDRLLNAVLLYENDQNNELILASIEQKSKQLKGINFLLAIPYEKLKLLAKWASIPFLLLLICWWWQPDVLKKGSQRIVAYQQDFAPENPYRFSILNPELRALRNQPFTLKLAFTGNEIPKDVFIEIGDKSYRLKEDEDNQFSYSIGQLNEQIDFRIKTGIFFSSQKSILPIDNAELKNLTVNVREPNYTGGKTYTIQNEGNLSVPEGSILTWNFETNHSKKVIFVANGDSLEVNEQYQLQVKKNLFYQFVLQTSTIQNQVNYNYDVKVTKDEYPEIELKTRADSLLPGVFYFVGTIKDDYGFTSFQLVYEKNDSIVKKELNFKPQQLSQGFASRINFYDLNLDAGQELSYRFEVSDNDQINGAKKTSTKMMAFTMPGKKSIDSLLNKESEELKNLMANTASQAQDLQKEFKEIQQLLVKNKNLGWQDQQKIQSFLKKQQSLEENLMKIQQENQQKNEQQQVLNPQEKELLEKQEQLNKLFEELLDEDTKKMFEELEKLMEQLNQQNQEESLEKINLNNENIEKSLDRTLELFKQMEFQQALENTINDLEKLAEEQLKLEEETKNSNNKDSEEILKKQEKINEEFKRLEEKLEDLKNKNEDLEQEQNFENTNEEQKDANESLKEAIENLKNKKQNAASKQQNDGAKSMQKIAEKLAKMQQQMQSDQNMEDLNTTRQLLENLVYLSFEQENLLEKTKQLSSLDAQYDVHIKNQQKLRDDAKVIEDSLFALSKRQIQLANFINKEMHEISFNSDKAISLLSERKPQSAAVNQQFVMTAANNLALILDEAIQAMQNAMMKQQFGTGSCNKPGGGKPKPGGEMKSLQQMLSKQLKQMKKQLGEGSKPGKSGKKGDSGDAMSFGKMAAEQNAIKERLKQLSQELQNKGGGGMGDAEQLQKELEKTEKELLNKTISPESIKRQEEILTRLLEAEKSIQEREYEDKRESQQGKNSFTRNPKDFLEYKNIEISNEELLKIALPSLNLFYKKKVNEYFNTLEK